MRKLSLKELNRVNVATFKAQEKTPLVIVLDNVRSALNVGSAFRTADAFALEKLYLCGITATPPHREILKTAIGATESMDWVYHKETKEALMELKTQGFQVLAVEQAADSVPLQVFRPTAGQKYALVFGNEVKGVGEDVMEMIDACLEVPQFGTKHSLNISVCLGVVVWDLFKQIKYQP